AVRISSPLEGRWTLILSGSPGEGIQQAAELLARAAMATGLHATKKGSYPVTRRGRLFDSGGDPVPFPDLRSMASTSPMR
ncbi:MAG: hypothetical protein RMK65_02625, partial [Anaerolineae bacterium]|nr:hypothetical protein [Anaerolineae bacterium]